MKRSSLMHRDPPSPAEAKKLAKQMYSELSKISPYLDQNTGPETNPAYLERASVLADVLGYTTRTDLAESLALAVEGRVTPLLGWSANSFLRAGDPIPLYDRSSYLRSVVTATQARLFPPRRSPCMPNAKELRTLVEQAQRTTGRAAAGALRMLNASMRHACKTPGWRAVEETMQVADEVLSGHGVESAMYILNPGYNNERIPINFYYVNTGDTYGSTLFGTHVKNGRTAFWISSFGDEVEAAERRYGDSGEWRR